ncbi:hypothetical protein [Silvimonas soli]|uniref:hypothetical protein n=1 Tax=Silvimonas soli TaxID=2980100 RepID=UPI0024B36704|nr:hypothetical protein [Silvimonas soli]
MNIVKKTGLSGVYLALDAFSGALTAGDAMHESLTYDDETGQVLSRTAQRSVPIAIAMQEGLELEGVLGAVNAGLVAQVLDLKAQLATEQQNAITRQGIIDQQATQISALQQGAASVPAIED